MEFDKYEWVRQPQNEGGYVKLWLENVDMDIISVLDTSAGGEGVTAEVAKYEMRITHRGNRYVRGMPKKTFDEMNEQTAVKMATEWIKSHQPLYVRR